MTDLRARIRAGETLIGVFSDLASPLAAELCGRAGFDWIVLDLEHGAATEADLLALLYAVGTTPMAADRPAAVGGAAAGRSGARPRGGRDHAAAAPVGRRGARGGRATCATRRSASGAWRCGRAGAGMGALGHADVARVVNERIVGIVQIESPGPSPTPTRSRRSTRSTSCSSVRPTCRTASGIPGRFDEPRYLDALRHGRRGVPSAHGKAAGILIYDAAALPPLLELGFRFIGLGSEASFVSSGRPRDARRRPAGPA